MLYLSPLPVSRLVVSPAILILQTLTSEVVCYKIWCSQKAFSKNSKFSKSFCSLQISPETHQPGYGRFRPNKRDYHSWRGYYRGGWQPSCPPLIPPPFYSGEKMPLSGITQDSLVRLFQMLEGGSDLKSQEARYFMRLLGLRSKKALESFSLNLLVSH